MPLKEVQWFMATCKKTNKTGPIEKSVKKAAVGFFNKYPNETVAMVVEGDNCGNNVFIAKIGAKQQEVLREYVF